MFQSLYSILIFGILLWTFLWVFQRLSTYQSNKKVARDLGLPYVTSFVEPWHPLWIASQRRLSPMLQKLPFGWGSFVRYTTWGWQIRDRYDLHRELGDAFFHVSPFGNELFLADPTAIDEVFSRRKDFLKPVKRWGPLELFGKHIGTTEGAEWQRHKKNTAPSFNDRANHLVWKESLRQGAQMMKFWTDKRASGFDSLVFDCLVLSANVIAAAVYGSSFDFSGFDDTTVDDSVKDRDSLITISQRFSLVVVTPASLRYLPFVPRLLADVAGAKARFKQYLATTIAREKHDMKHGNHDSGNLARSLIMSSKEAQQSSTPKVVGHASAMKVLTDEEIGGNLFMYNMAGQETTSHSLSYSVLLLAAYPECQDWIAEEIRTVFPNGFEGVSDIAVSARLKRVQSLMVELTQILIYTAPADSHQQLETLRVFSPIGAVAKLTSDQVQVLTIKDRTIALPPHTNVLPNMYAMHSHPDYWGPDPLVWRPQRWVHSPLSASSSSVAEILDAETLFESPKGTYFPWSDGVRVCPGKQFSQVEFLAVMSQLFRDHRVEVVPGPGGESAKGSSQRIWSALNDIAMRVFVQMTNPRAITLRLVRKEVDTQ